MVFVKGSVKINLQKFFRVTTAILFFVAAQLVISGLHELSENGVLPSSRQEMAIIGPIVRNDLFFFITILALAGLMVLFEMRGRQPVELPAAGAARRKALWTARKERLWMASVYVCSFLFIVMVTASFIYEKSASALSPATEVTFVDGKVSIPLKQVYDGELHRYEAKEGGVEVRFWLYQKPDGKIATLFDACEICGPVGFYKGAQGVICKNCAAPINPQSVGMPGGCNPDSAEGAGHRRRGDRLRGRRRGRPTLLRAEIECFPASSTNRFAARHAASCSRALPSRWASRSPPP